MSESNQISDNSKEQIYENQYCNQQNSCGQYYQYENQINHQHHCNESIKFTRKNIEEWDFFEEYINFFTNSIAQQNFQRQKFNSMQSYSFPLNKPQLKNILLNQQSFNNSLRILQLRMIKNGFVITQKKKEQIQPQFQNDEIQIKILNHTKKYEVIEIYCRFGSYSKVYTVLNILKQSFNHECLTSGFGGMGQIYLTKNRINNQLNVIKCLRFASDASFQLKKHVTQFFINDMMSALETGPKIIRNFGFDFLLFQNCLEFELQKCQNLKLPDAQQDIKSCLFQIHLLGIVHCDIKPSNIMYSKSFFKNVLIDFGISELLTQNLGSKKLSKFKGTYEFCGKQMQQIISKQFPKNIDFYKNDVLMLSKSLSFMKIKDNFQPSVQKDLVLLEDQYYEYDTFPDNIYSSCLLKTIFQLYKMQFKNKFIEKSLSNFYKTLDFLSQQSEKQKFVKEIFYFALNLKTQMMQLICNEKIFKDNGYFIHQNYSLFDDKFHVQNNFLQNQSSQIEHLNQQVQQQLFKQRRFLITKQLTKLQHKKSNFKVQNQVQKTTSFRKYNKIKLENIQFILFHKEQILKFSKEQYFQLFIHYTSFWLCLYQGISVDKKQKAAQIMRQFIENSKSKQKIDQFEYMKLIYLPDQPFIKKYLSNLVYCYSYLLSSCTSSNTPLMHNSSLLQNFKQKYLMIILKQTIILNFKYCLYLTTIFSQYIYYLIEIKCNELVSIILVQNSQICQLVFRHYSFIMSEQVKIIIEKKDNCLKQMHLIKYNVKDMIKMLDKKIKQNELFKKSTKNEQQYKSNFLKVLSVLNIYRYKSIDTLKQYIKNLILLIEKQFQQQQSQQNAIEASLDKKILLDSKLFSKKKVKQHCKQNEQDYFITKVKYYKYALNILRLDLVSVFGSLMYDRHYHEIITQTKLSLKTQFHKIVHGLQSQIQVENVFMQFYQNPTQINSYTASSAQVQNKKLKLIQKFDKSINCFEISQYFFIRHRLKTAIYKKNVGLFNKIITILSSDLSVMHLNFEEILFTDLLSNFSFQNFQFNINQQLRQKFYKFIKINIQLQVENIMKYFSQKDISMTGLIVAQYLLKYAIFDKRFLQTQQKKILNTLQNKIDEKILDFHHNTNYKQICKQQIQILYNCLTLKISLLKAFSLQQVSSKYQLIQFLHKIITIDYEKSLNNLNLSKCSLMKLSFSIIIIQLNQIRYCPKLISKAWQCKKLNLTLINYLRTIDQQNKQDLSTLSNAALIMQEYQTLIQINIFFSKQVYFQRSGEMQQALVVQLSTFNEILIQNTKEFYKILLEKLFEKQNQKSSIVRQTYLLHFNTQILKFTQNLMQNKHVWKSILFSASKAYQIYPKLKKQNKAIKKRLRLQIIFHSIIFIENNSKQQKKTFILLQKLIKSIQLKEYGSRQMKTYMQKYVSKIMQRKSQQRQINLMKNKFKKFLLNSGIYRQKSKNLTIDWLIKEIESDKDLKKKIARLKFQKSFISEYKVCNIVCFFKDSSTQLCLSMYEQILKIRQILKQKLPGEQFKKIQMHQCYSKRIIQKMKDQESINQLKVKQLQSQQSNLIINHQFTSHYSPNSHYQSQQYQAISKLIHNYRTLLQKLQLHAQAIKSSQQYKIYQQTQQLNFEIIELQISTIKNILNNNCIFY